MKLEVYKIEQSAITPTRATEQSSCFDVYACLHDDISVYYKGGKGVKSIQTNDGRGKSIVVRPRERIAVPTGIILNIPEGHDVKLYARSGLSLKNGIGLSNSVGVIDNDYKDELFVTVINNSDDVFILSDGMSIAQFELAGKLQYKLEETTDKPQTTTDRKGGLGSTGTDAKKEESPQPAPEVEDKPVQADKRKTKMTDTQTETKTNKV